MSKIAFFSDVHGNIEALDAVLSDIKESDVERVICLGDLASYNADQHACMQRLRDKEIEWIAGNHDLIAAGILEPLSCSPYAFYSSTRARKSLAPVWRDYIWQLPLMIVESGFCAFHASPEKVDEYLITKQRLRRAATVIHTRKLPPIAFFGHTHQKLVSQLKGESMTQSVDSIIPLDPEAICLVNVGTVGEPRGKDKDAHYVIFDNNSLQVSFHRVEYDYETCLERSVEQGWRRRHREGLTAYYDKYCLKVAHLRHKLIPHENDDSQLDKVLQRMGSL